MKHLKLAAIALLCATGFTACSEDDGPQGPVIDPSEELTETTYVLNQGSYYDGIEGSLDALDNSTGLYVTNFFSSANDGLSLGGSPQNGIIYGSKMYIALFESKLVWVCNARTGKIIKQITMTDPEGICAADGKVYVSNNDGYVSYIDTLSLEAGPNRLYVGPNPSGLVAANGHVYVAISDGYNYLNGYADGFKVAKIRTSDFSKSTDITVGMNPTGIAADTKGNVFVVCNGNYGMLSPEVKPEVWKITPDDQAASFAPGTQIAVNGTSLYAVYNYTSYATYITEPLACKVYDTESGEEKIASFLPDEVLNCPPMPISISVDDSMGLVYITSDPSSFGYNLPGYVYIYKASNGEFIGRYQTGVHPCAVFFK